MSKRILISWLAAAACGAALAQTPASAPASAVRKELIARIVKAQKSGIEGLARGLAEEPARALVGQAKQVIAQRVPAERRTAVSREVEADVRKYLDDAVPLVRDRALQLAPAALSAALEQKFSDDELRQVAGFLESPTYAKYQLIAPDLAKALAAKVVAEMRPVMEPKVRALDDAIARRIGQAPAASASAAASAARKPGN